MNLELVGRAPRSKCGLNSYGSSLILTTSVQKPLPSATYMPGRTSLPVPRVGRAQ